MANQKVTQLPSLSAASGNTLIYVVDVSDTTDDPSGSSKQITRDDVLKNITGLTADTISATTYQNLPTDIRVTGGTYSNGTATFTNNTGGTFTVTGFTASTSYTTDYIDFNTGATVTSQYGRIYWDAGTGTLNVGIGDATTGLIDFQVGQEEVVRVYNEEATTLQKGEIVYVYGSQGNRPSVKRAQAQGDLYSVTTLGMVDLPITSGSQGYVTTFGIISNLNTLGLTGGTPVWLSPTTPGGYTATKPKAPDHTVLIGYVVRVSATVGSIFVNISNGWELDEIHDVRITSATEGDLLMRSSYSGSPVWVNTKTLNGSYTITGNTNVEGNLNVTGNTVINSFTAGTGNINGDLNVTGDTTLDGLTANTISATTYQNLPIDPDTYVTGFTYNDNEFVIQQNNGQPDLTAVINSVTGWTVNGDLNVTGDTIVNNLTATTISATTYQNLPIDPDTYVTAFTYNDNVFTISQNNGQPDLTAIIDTVTGWTVNGNLNVTGDTVVDNLTATTVNNVQYIDFDITNTGTTSSPGRLFWDVNNRTLSLGMIGGPVQQIGEEQYFLVENQTGGILSDGVVVRATGTTGNSGKLTINTMIANGTIPAFTTIGVLTQPLNNGDTGYVTSFGLVRGIDTTGTPYGETWSQGDILYVSPTISGGFTKVRPITPNQDIIVAIVMEVGASGSIFVRPDVYRPFKDPQLITVAKANGDFTSIKDAVDSITGSSSSNRYVVEVGPGEFNEGEIDLSSKPYISVVGSSIQTTLVTPTGSTQHIFKLGQTNEISFLTLSGAGTNYAGIYCYDVGDFAQAHKISIFDCDTGVWVESDTQDTKFYGEYIDINGEFTYGVKSIGNNNFLCLVNMENYYVFQGGTGNTYGNYATGSGATVNLTSSSLEGNGATGSTATLSRDGAFYNLSATDVSGWGYGHRTENVGNPSKFEYNGVTYTDNIWDINVEQVSATGIFNGISSHVKITTVSENVFWNFLDADDGELDITRKASVTFTDGSHTDFTTLVFEGGPMGLISGGQITVISAFTINTASGFGYLEKSDNIGIVRRIDWTNSTLTLSANTNEYVYINENSILTSSGTRPSSVYNIILGRVVTNGSGVEFIDLSPVNAEHMANRYGNLLRNAIGPIYSTGSIVTENVTPFHLDVTQGEYYYASNEFMPSGGTDITFTQYYRNGTGATWITSATTVVNNTQFDNNGTLTALTASYYTKHTLYVVGQGSYEKYFLVLGQNQYATLVEAEDALLPTPPTFFSDAVSQIASVYIQQGTTGITQIQDIRPVIGFKAGGVNASSTHGNLLGLSADDHTQYLLVSGTRPMSGNLNMGGNNIVSAGTVNGVTVETHATRHQYGGADPVGTVTPSANAIPFADVNGKLDSWVSTATTSTLGRVKLSTAPVSASDPIVVGQNDTRFTGSFTGVSYSNNTFTFTTVGGGSLTSVINTVTGWTVNGNLTVTGNTTVGGNLTVTGNTGTNWFSSNTSSDLVRITQTGSGNALVVEDSTNPDGTPFVVNNAGRVGIGAQPSTNARLRVYPEYPTDYYGILVEGSPTVGVQANGVSTGVYGGSPSIGGYFIATNNSSTLYGVQGITFLADPEQPINGLAIGGYFKVDPGTATSQYAVQLMDGTEGVGKVLVSQTSDGKANWSSSLSGLTSINTGTLTVTGNTSLQATTASTISATSITATTVQIKSGATQGYVLKSLDSNGNAYWDPIRITNTATTTNATITTLATINTIPDNATSYIEVFVKAYQASATNWGIWKRTLTVTKVSGTVTIQEENADVDKQSSGLSATSISFSGTSGNVLVQVTGIAATNIDWKSAHEIIL